MPATRGSATAFLEDAIEHSNGIELDGQGTTAREAAEAYGCRTDGPAPRGAYVFFDAVGPLNGAVRNWGHIGLSLGDGRMVHAWDVVRVDPIAAVELLAGPPGWSPLVYTGWAPIERVLVNARPRRRAPGRVAGWRQPPPGDGGRCEGSVRRPRATRAVATRAIASLGAAAGARPR